jgi:hypothetical protein
MASIISFGGARSEEMMMGTWCFTHTSTSCARRSFDWCTIWLTAMGPTRLSGLAAWNAANSACSSVSQVSSSSAGRAFSAGKEPTMPALHCAATSFGPLAMNIGDAMTGRVRFCSTGGRAMSDSEWNG